MDIVEFAEKIMGVELLDYQKKMLVEFSKLPPGARLAYLPSGRICVVSDVKGEK
ncbi:MAG: hypothetical protein J6B01_04935 [Ruminococcus sp.]|nr:hypothetical protein [Ruminococcus sp.]MBO5319137.1 hypothetical protein [Ruminococcus sp.]